MVSSQSRRFITILFAVCLLLQFKPPVRSQEKVTGARKFDEFGDVQYSDKIARLDNFAVQLQNEPNTRGFIMVYRTRRDLPGISNRFALWMKNYMVARSIPKDRVVTVDGGEAGCFSHELWIVPVGATPAPRPDAYSSSYVSPDVPLKFDEHYYALAGDDYGNGYESLEAYLDGFGTALRQQAGSQAYIIAYAQYYIERSFEEDAAGRRKSYRRTYLDRPGTAAKMLKAERDYLIKSFGIAPSRIKVVDGGYRTSRGIELWIVPPGAHPPIPTPNQFPGRRRRR